MMDEELLQALDKDREVQRLGRSAVIRQITIEYLKRERRNEIAKQYKHAYEPHKGALEEDFGAWSNEGIWPEK